MEFRSPHDEAEEDGEETARREQGFLSAWIERIRRDRTDATLDSGPEDYENEDDEENTVPANRWRRSFRRLFSRVVQREDTVMVPAEADDRTDDLTRESSRLSSEPETTSSITEESEDVNHISSESETGLFTAEVDQEPVSDNDIYEDSKGLQEYPKESKLATRKLDSKKGAEQVLFERTPRVEQIGPQDSANKEAGQEKSRGAGLVAGLVGLEFMARRRADRKLKKEIVDSQRELEHNKQVISDIERNNRKTVGRLQEERQHVLKPESTSERKLSKVPEVLQKPERQKILAEEVTSPDTGKGPEALSVRENQSAVNVEKGPPTDKNKAAESKDMNDGTDNKERHDIEAANRQPEKVMEQVAVAAEKNIPIERHYERRHEIKDEANQPLAAGASSVGSIITEMHQQASSVPEPKTPAVKALPISTQGMTPTDDGMYKKAVISGFWAALLIIIVFICIATMSVG